MPNDIMVTIAQIDNQLRPTSWCKSNIGQTCVTISKVLVLVTTVISFQVPSKPAIKFELPI